MSEEVFTEGVAEISNVGSECKPISEPTITLLEFFRSSPLVGFELDVERNPDFGRDHVLE